MCISTGCGNAHRIGTVSEARRYMMLPCERPVMPTTMARRPTISDVFWMWTLGGRPPACTIPGTLSRDSRSIHGEQKCSPHPDPEATTQTGSSTERRAPSGDRIGTTHLEFVGRVGEGTYAPPSSGKRRIESYPMQRVVGVS